MIDSGDKQAAEQLLPLVYEKLRKLAQGGGSETVVIRADFPEAWRGCRNNFVVLKATGSFDDPKHGGRTDSVRCDSPTPQQKKYGGYEGKLA